MPIDAELARAFAERADGVRDGGMPLVGLFGEGIPALLVSASGGLAVDVKAPPLADADGGPVVSTVAEVVEDFMDAYATRFLHRYAAGAFDHFAMIVFARDDVAALAAYHYARELQRQGRVDTGGPRLHLWNMLHTDSAPVRAFNGGELTRFEDALADVLGLRCDDAAFEEAASAETERRAALALLPPGGEEAFVARNAGRWLSASHHAALIKPSAKAIAGPSIALVGTAFDVPVLHQIASEFGTVVADLQDYGRAPALIRDRADLLDALALDTLHIRCVPANRFSDALRRGTSGADIVIASVDENDDAFGWEIPAIRASVEARNGTFIDLGFRPFRPDAQWQNKARARIAEAIA